MRDCRSLLLAGIIAACAAAPVASQTNVAPPGVRRPTVPAKPRIPPLPESQYTDGHKQLLARFASNRALDHGLDTLLQLPPLAEAVMPFTIYLVNDSTLLARHRELLILRTAWLSGSQVVWSDHVARALNAGISTQEIRRVAEGAGAAGWNPFEATLLRLADELYRNSSVSNATWTTLAATYDQFHLMDAVETVNHFTMLSTMYNAFGVQPGDKIADRLPTDVQYRVSVPDREPPLTKARVDPVPGDGIAVSRTLAQHPKMNQARGPRANFINRVSKLQPRHREMFILRIGWDCRSEYEWAQHVGNVGRAREHGLDPQRIAQGPDAPGWNPLERAILRAVDELYRDATISDATWSTLAGSYSTDLLMSGVFTATSYRATSMVLNALGVQLEPGNERFPQVK